MGYGGEQLRNIKSMSCGQWEDVEEDLTEDIVARTQEDESQCQEVVGGR